MNGATGIHRELYEYLETGFPGASQLKDNPLIAHNLRNKLKRFTEKTGVTLFEPEHPEETGFDKIWVFDFNKTTLNNSNLYMIGLNTQTQEVQGLRIKCHRKKQDPEIFATQFAEHRLNPFPILGTGKSEKKRVSSFDELYKALSYQRRRTADRLQSHFKTAAREKDWVDLGASFLEALRSRTSELLEEYLNHCLERIYELTDNSVLGWAQEIHESGSVENRHSQFDIYNYIVKAASPQARGYRYTALLQFAKLGNLFFHAPFWDQIDNGSSPIKLLAEHMKVSPATLKRISKMPDIFGFGSKSSISYHAPFLDAIDHSLWPDTQESVSYFKACQNVADLYREFFDKNPYEVMAGWVKSGKSRIKNGSPDVYWGHMAFNLLSTQINKMAATPSKHMFFVPKALRMDLWQNVKLPYEQFSDLPEKLREIPAFLDKAKEMLESDIKNIKDMKADISKRLVMPAVLLDFERRDYRIVEQALLNYILELADSRIWGSMSPADQIAANDFWHSPHVDMKRRFESAALAGGQQEQWPFLFGEDSFEVIKGVFVHPLCSSASLSEESDAMTMPNQHRFCIWSYASNFYTRNYHMMSLRDVDGQRICSLTVQDYFEDGNRKVRFIENKKKGNFEPDAAGRYAAGTIIKLLNNGEVIVDWPAIDAARSEYKIRQIENAAGYDIRDVDRRQAVFEAYISCLPKKAVRAGDKTFEGFMKEIRISSLVEDFIGSFDFSKGGIIRLAPPVQAVQKHQNNFNQPRAALG